MRRITTEESNNSAWSRIGNEEGSQMAWFVKLANTTGFTTMCAEDQMRWQEEFEAMRLRGHAPAMGGPLDSKRYPRPDNPLVSLIDPPTPSEMQEVRDVIREPINRLADGHETWIPKHDVFKMTYSVQFIGNPAYFEEPDTEPRYLVCHNEGSADLGPNPYQRSLLFRLLRLLEAFPDKRRRDNCADKLRRCPHCRKVFIQVKRSGKYCGAGCYTVAGMQRLRAQLKAQLAIKKTTKRRVRKPKRKAELQRGKAKL